MAGKIVVMGSLNMDLVGCAPRIPVVGETIVGHKFFTEPGGKGANQAYGAATLGGRVSMLGRVGSDDFGREMRANLEKVGCDVTGLLTIQGATSGIALIYVADDGHNSIIIVPGANDLYSPADVDAGQEYLKGAALVLLQLEKGLSPPPDRVLWSLQVELNSSWAAIIGIIRVQISGLTAFHTLKTLGIGQL